jgi:hypothetical protein
MNNLFFDSTLPGEPSQRGNATTVFESDGSISDVFGVVQPQAGGPFFVGFISDTGTPLTSSPDLYAPFGGTKGLAVTETAANGGAFDASFYVLADHVTGFSATFQSDLEGVPEPSTFALLCLGGLGLAGYAWRRRKQAV